LPDAQGESLSVTRGCQRVEDDQQRGKLPSKEWREGQPMPKLLYVLITVSSIVAGQHVILSSNPLLRHYSVGQRLTYHMKGINEDWHYEIQADGIVKKDSEGTYFEEYGWSRLISDGQAVTLSPASSNFRQQLTLDPNHKPVLPNLTQVDPRLIGPVTDSLTFYVDVWLAARTGKLAQSGDHYYFKQGTPVSWADGNHVLLGQSSIDFDFTLKDINRASDTATLIARHVPPAEIEVKLPAEWMRKPVADTANNWVTVERMKDQKFLGAVGKEIFNDEIVLSLSDGRILSATMDNQVQTLERECTDSSVTQCGEAKPHFIRRQIEISLER
jgi:hypothetical protein